LCGLADLSRSRGTSAFLANKGRPSFVIRLERYWNSQASEGVKEDPVAHLLQSRLAPIPLKQITVDEWWRSLRYPIGRAIIR